jgi:hypothetical protein
MTRPVAIDGADDAVVELLTRYIHLKALWMMLRGVPPEELPPAIARTVAGLIDQIETAIDSHVAAIECHMWEPPEYRRDP